MAGVSDKRTHGAEALSKSDALSDEVKQALGQIAVDGMQQRRLSDVVGTSGRQS